MSGKGQAGRLTLQYSFLQSVYWMGFCVIYGFAAVFLLDKGFSGKEIGVILALANICAALLQPIVASFADQSQKGIIKELIIAMTLIVIGLTMVLIIAPAIMGITALVFILISTLMLTIQPLLNALILDYINQGIPINYGLARGIGSISFATLSFSLGFIVSRYSPAILPYLYIFFYVLICLVAASFKAPIQPTKPKPVVTKSSKVKESKLKGLFNFFKGYQHLFLLLTAICCLFIFHNIINTYLIQIIQHVGGNDSDFGISLALAAGLELPMMMAFAFFVRKINGSTLLKASAIFFTIKAVVFLLAPNVAVIYLGQSLQMLSFALYIPASVYYINELMQPQDKVKGQALVMTATTLGGVFGNLLGGTLLDSYGVFVMLLVGTVISLIGTLLLCYSVKEV